MQLFCPACNAAFFGDTRCPRCGGLLLMPHEVSPDAPKQLEPPPPHAQTTAMGRIVLGSLVAMGVYLSIRKISIGTILAFHSQEGWWMSLQGLTAIYAIQAVSVVAGATIAAAGRSFGYSLGFIVGGVCGGVYLGFEIITGASLASLVLYLQPPVLALIGLVAGAFGSRIWPPAPELHIPLPSSSKLSSLQLGDDLNEEESRPTWWIHVLAGAVIIVLGAAFADPFRSTVQRNSGGILRVESHGQGEFITWQFAVLVAMSGGVFAAAGTGAGVRHGVMAGFFGAIGIIAVCQHLGEPVAPVYYFLVRTTLDELPFMSPTVLLAVASGVVAMGAIGGWLGGTLFPTLAPPHMRKRAQVGLD